MHDLYYTDAVLVRSVRCCEDRFYILVYRLIDFFVIFYAYCSVQPQISLKNEETNDKVISINFIY